MTDPRRQRYKADLCSPDPTTRAVAARQLERLHPRRHPSPPTSRPSPWAHVPLADLFASQGNPIHGRSDAVLECGHEPIHSSTSGLCVRINPALGRWWCRSCRQSGDAVSYLTAVRGCGYHEAAAWLTTRWGPPADNGQAARRRPRRLVLEAVLP